MRLLSSKEWKFTKFEEDHLPSYMILFHRWEEGEITYPQVLDYASHPPGSGNPSIGLQKLLQFCRQARDDKYEYVWLDTCCIDKSSSAELSEAINSMFKWYAGARICYAYLFDATQPADIPHSEWITRAWTLQELLASRQLSFFGPRASGDHVSRWQYLPNKTTLITMIAKATGVPADCHENVRNIYNQPVAVRMSWASTRQSTRIENKAYSLLEIFDINMPLLYGEGEKAFRRLQEEIIRTSDD